MKPTTSGYSSGGPRLKALDQIVNMNLFLFYIPGVEIMMKLCEIVLNQLHTSAQLLQLLSTINMSKRTHSEIVAPTTDPSTPAVESPKKRGRPFKKLDPLPREVMKALNILNAYVEKQQAQAQAASDSDVTSEEETKEEDKKTTKSTKKIAKTNYYLINVEDPEMFSQIDLSGKDKETIDIIKEYLIIQNNKMKLDKQFNKGMDINEYVTAYSAIDGKHSELAIKLHEKDVFTSKYDIRTYWKLKKM